jgi:pimeloyl-ACP methyl ester carboxylesterase
MLRHAPLYDYTEGWTELGVLGKPTLFVWGELDVSFPFSNAEKAAALIPHSKIVGIKEAAHWVNIEKPALVNEAVISFLNE